MTDIYTNLGLIIISLVAIFLVLLWRLYKLKDAGEGDRDLIDMGFGTHTERWAFEARIVIGLIICFFMLLAGLLGLALELWVQH